jgi:hypothetical protein
MQRIDFEKDAREAIDGSVRCLKEKTYTKGMKHLNTITIQFDKIVKDISGGKLGIGLLPSSKQQHAILTEHRFYILGIVTEDRKSMVGALDIIAVAINGYYPVYFLTDKEQPIPLVNEELIKGRMLDHCVGETLTKAIAALKV